MAPTDVRPRLTLVIGNRNYSSWSLRAWLVLKRTGHPFEEVMVGLYRPDSRDMVLVRVPSGLVPGLEIDGRRVWDSLAIAETMAEMFPAAGLWPADAAARAHARAISAEMHAGFQALRDNMPMDIGADKAGEGLTPEVEHDIQRIAEIWETTRAVFGAGGDFLFGRFTIADAMYAPVTTRFRTYGVDAGETAAAYGEAIRNLPEMGQWIAAARDEPPLGE